MKGMEVENKSFKSVLKSLETDISTTTYKLKNVEAENKELAAEIDVHIADIDKYKRQIEQGNSRISFLEGESLIQKNAIENFEGKWIRFNRFLYRNNQGY